MAKLSDFERTMTSCNHCGQCKWILPSRMSGWDFAEICPIYQRHGFDACSGQGLINIAKERMLGRLEYGDGLEDLIYSCSCCGACDVNCKSIRDMELLETIYALREDCAKSGFLPDAHREAARKIAESHNLHGLPQVSRFDFLPEGVGDSPLSDTLLFVGCSGSAHPENILSAIKILCRGGVDFRLLREEEWCCGSYLWRSGQTEAAEELIKRNTDLFKSRGIKRIICVCAECYGAFRAIYPRFCSPDFEILHISEVAAELIESGAISPRPLDKPLRVTYHDPCSLGRLSEEYVPWEGEIGPYGLHVPEKQWRRGEHGQYHAPRRILSAIEGLELVEMPRHMEEAFCCGAGGGVAAANPEMAAWTAGERLREARSTGAEMIVSACPFCQDALSPADGDAMGYIDLCVLLADRL